MEAVLKHIEHDYVNPVYSKIYFQQGIGIVQDNFTQRGARCVLVKYLYWVPQGTAVQIDFKDQFKNIFFSTFDAVGVETSIPIFMVNRGQQLRITCSLATMVFSVSYQYIL